MELSPDKQKLIHDFHAFIENLPDPALAETPLNHVDLLTLLQELAALKTEVKQESRQLKSALDSFKEVFATLQQSHQTLSQELADRRQEQQHDLQKQKQLILKPLLLDLVDLYDRIKQAMELNPQHRPSWFARLFKRELTVIAALKESQEICLRRLEQLLSNHDVHPIPTENQPFNPHTMRAVALEHYPDLANDSIVQEIQAGFLWHDNVLRVAEVTINKHKEASTHE